MYVVTLRERRHDNWTRTNTFMVDDHIIDPEIVIRAAVSEFLDTEMGKEHTRRTCYNFNWGDAVTYVPEEIWNKHGLHFKGVKNMEFKVNQDEVLCKDEKEQD